MTEIREDHFGIDLPGAWDKAVSLDEGTEVYKQSDGEAIVTVTLLGVRPSFAIADKQRLLEDYMSHRAKYEKGKIATLEDEEATSWPDGDAFAGKWSAEDTASGRRRAHRVILTGELLADFLYDAPADDAGAFEESADAILGTATASAE